MYLFGLYVYCFCRVGLARAAAPAVAGLPGALRAKRIRLDIRHARRRIRSTPGNSFRLMPVKPLPF
jgi:hypothetical protein